MKQHFNLEIKLMKEVLKIYKEIHHKKRRANLVLQVQGIKEQIHNKQFKAKIFSMMLG